jgi:hypothetical protein
MPKTSKTLAMAHGHSDDFPPSSRATPTATDATGGRHKSRAIHQSTFDRYQFIVPADIDASIIWNAQEFAFATPDV